MEFGQLFCYFSPKGNLMASRLSQADPLNGVLNFRGFPIRFHQAGQGEPMIMLHNGGASHHIWQQQISHFSASYHVFALDLLGFGASGRPRQPLTLELYVEMLTELIRQRKLQAPILMGNCIGAAIALAYAQAHPAQVRALILANLCGGQSMMRPFHPFMFSRRGLYSDRWYRCLFALARWEWVRRRVTDRLYGKTALRQSELYGKLLEGGIHPAQTQSRLMLIKGLPSFNSFDQYQRPDRELPPIYLCWGAHNRVLPLHRGEYLQQQLKPDVWAVYPKLGHLLMAEAPDRFNAEVEAFLAES